MQFVSYRDLFRRSSRICSVMYAMSRFIRHTLRNSLVVAGLLITTSSPRAQNAPPGATAVFPQEPASQKVNPFAARTGFVVGVGLHVGKLLIDGQSLGSGGALDLMLGWNVAERFVVVTNFVMSGVGSGAGTLNELQALIALQYWPIEYGWIRGGLGVSSLSAGFSGPDPSLEEDFDNWVEGRDTAENGSYGIDSGAMVQLAGGYDVWESSATSLELQLRLHYSRYRLVDVGSTMITVGIDFAWY